MAYEVIINKRFSKKLLLLLDYLKAEFGERVANDFQDTVLVRINLLKINPYIGGPTGITSVRSTLVTKHNRLYYRIKENKIVILNLYDTRSTYKK